jgi:hypothetical protein
MAAPEFLWRQIYQKWTITEQKGAFKPNNRTTGRPDECCVAKPGQVA